MVDPLKTIHGDFERGRRWIYGREETYQKLLQQISEQAAPPVRAEAGALLNELKK